MVRTFLSYRARQELLVRVAPRYQEAGVRRKSRILDEFVACTGYARKCAIRLLHGPVRPPAPMHRTWPPRYGPAVRDALTVAWSAVGGICAKRLVPFLPELLSALERHGHLHLDAEVRSLLLTLSPATADRLLRPVRQADQPRGLSTTKPGRLLKHQVPVRTFAEWDDVRPGFCEADLVAHCGGNTEGVFLYTLTLTDVATGWTECLALLHRGQDAVVHALAHARRLLPFPLLGLDTDNGGEFRDAAVLAYCAETETTFTRGRVAHSNDQCFVEQKNGSIVRQLVGYDRYVGEPAYRQLTELYRAVRLYVNFFQPSLKLQAKQRDGSRVRRRYDVARTPFQRVVASGVLDPTTRTRLERIAHALDPVRLLHQIQTLQDALWRHAILTPSAMAAQPTREAIRFDVGACSTADDGATVHRGRGRLPGSAAAPAALSAGAEEAGTAHVSHATRPVRGGVGRAAPRARSAAGAHGEGGVPGAAAALSRPVPRCAAAHAPATGEGVAGERAGDVRGALARGGVQHGAPCGGAHRQRGMRTRRDIGARSAAMTQPDASAPFRNDGVTIPCPVCGRGFAPVGRRRFCTDACRQAAWRRRHPLAAPDLPPRPPRAHTIYECPACLSRFLGEQRCPDCQRFCRRVGPGGTCPHCGEPVAVADLVAVDGA